MQHFLKLPIEEQINIFIQDLSGHAKECEISNTLAIATAYKMSDETYLAYFEELTSDEIIEKLETDLRGGYEEEFITWNVIIKTLGADKVYDIISNYEKYFSLYAQRTNVISDLTDAINKLYAMAI